MSDEVSTPEVVLTEKRGRILIITINRPEAKPRSTDVVGEWRVSE